MRLEIGGIDATVAILAGLPKKIIRKGVASGSRAVGKEAAKDVKAVVPVKSGAVRRSIGSKMLKKRGDELAALKIGGTRKVKRAGIAKSRKQDYILRFLEGGVKRHVLRGWDASGSRLGTQALRKLNKTNARPAKSVMHPGFRARWLLRQVMQRNNGKYGKAFADGVRASLAAGGA